MDDTKFLFVSCVNNEKQYQTCLAHINELNIPKGYSVDTYAIYDAKGMAWGYNQALENKAKYKIYLHQDTYICNKKFLYGLLDLFKENPTLGLIGMVGTKNLPANGVWWEGRQYVGKIYGFPDKVNMKEVFFGPVENYFESVDAVDGLLMATQYDLRWRDDLFSGFHFYDTSQAVEFRKRGFLVGIPNQEDPWCIHVGKELGPEIRSVQFQDSMKIFRSSYSDFQE